MAEAKAVWKGGMSFDGSAGSGFSLSMGASSDVGGADDGFRPLELLLVGLAGCTAMDVISILKKKRQEVTDFSVSVQAERASDHPKVYTKINLEYKISGKGLDRVAVERAIELSETKYCSAQAMLGKTAQIENTLIVLESD